MRYRAFSAGQYKIRERGNKYYIYKIEKDNRSNAKETSLIPLDKIMEFYLAGWGWRDLNPRPPGPKPGILALARLQPHFLQWIV